MRDTDNAGTTKAWAGCAVSHSQETEGGRPTSNAMSLNTPINASRQRVTYDQKT